MPPDTVSPGRAGWSARLALAFERRGGRTVLASKAHDGPLVVQKSLHPEGSVCHAIVVHPPAGIAGGDDLSIDVHAGEGAEALLTTPGAGKWYRSAGDWARQRVTLSGARASCVEWLPQETILFDASLADISFEARLEGDARLIAWDIVCLGRRGSGERFASGRCRTHARIYRDGRLLWWERARIGGEDRLAASPAGLAGASVFATFMLAAPEIDDAWLQSAREASPGSGIGGVTRLPGLLLARYRGDSSEDARDYFTRLWSCLREPVTGHPAMRPRIWST